MPICPKTSPDLLCPITLIAWQTCSIVKTPSCKQNYENFADSAPIIAHLICVKHQEDFLQINDNLFIQVPLRIFLANHMISNTNNMLSLLHQRGPAVPASPPRSCPWSSWHTSRCSGPWGAAWRASWQLTAQPVVRDSLLGEGWWETEAVGAVRLLMNLLLRLSCRLRVHQIEGSFGIFNFFKNFN